MMLSTLNIHHLLSDPLRLHVLEILMSGEGCTAGELARILQVSPSQLSHHLKILVESRLLKCEPMGRHRLYLLANERVAGLLEGMVTIARDFKIHAYRVDPELKQARSCYKHLAGDLGIKLFQACLRKNFIKWESDAVLLTPEGVDFFRQFQFDDKILKQTTVKYCIDFSERRPHLAGDLGRALLEYFVVQGWLKRRAQTRILLMTPLGKQCFQTLLNFQ